MKRLLPLLFVISLVTFQVPGTAHACSCMMPEPLQESIDEAEVIFSGVVTNIQEVERDFGVENLVTMRVTQHWKGLQPDEQQQVVVRTFKESAACGYPFEVGTEELIYAGRDSYLSVGICGASKPLAAAEEDLALLGEGLPLPSFKDVSSNHPNADAIAYVKAEGIVGGYSDGTYRPDQTINRAEFTKIIAAVYGSIELEKCAKEWDFGKMFSDVRAGDWFAPYVCVASKHDVVNGYPDRTFRGSNRVNFAEAAKMLTFRYNLYGDVTNVWYERGVRALARRGAIPISILTFDQFITRGEMAEMIYRLDFNMTDKPTKTYEDLAGGNSTGTSLFSDLVLGVTFDYPSSWNAPITKLEKFYSNGGIPRQAADWGIFIGTPCDGCAEGDNQHPFELLYYELELAGTIEADLRNDDLVTIKSEMEIEGASVTIFTQGGICGNLEALIVGERRAYVLRGNCAADSAEKTHNSMKY